MQEMSKDESIRGKLIKAQKSPMKTYMELTAGNVGFLRLFLYESLTSLIGPLPGALGFFFRQKCYRPLFKKLGRSPIIGRNVTFRHPNKIEIGDNVTIDDNCVIDARGAGAEGLVLEDQVIINRNCMILAKAGPVRIRRRASLGSNSIISTVRGVEIGEAVLITGNCYLNDGIYQHNDVASAIMDQGVSSKGPIRIGAKYYLRAGAMIVEGVSIGAGAVIGPGAIVENDIPKYAIATGVPAKVVGMRDTKDSE